MYIYIKTTAKKFKSVWWWNNCFWHKILIQSGDMQAIYNHTHSCNIVEQCTQNIQGQTDRWLHDTRTDRHV